MISAKTMSASSGDETISLTPNEFALLFYMIKNCERAISRNELLEQVWGFHAEVETRAADDTVRRLRKKLANSNVEVSAIWGFGFKLKQCEDNE